jgi:hypothetical protein
MALSIGCWRHRLGLGEFLQRRLDLARSAVLGMKLADESVGERDQWRYSSILPGAESIKSA